MSKLSENSFIQAVLHWVQERAIQNPAALVHLKSLEGRTLLIDLQEPEVCISCTFRQDRLALSLNEHPAPDMRMSCTAKQLVTLAFAKDVPSQLAKENITISGETSTIMTVQQLLPLLKPEWNALLVHLVGPLRASIISKGGNVAFELFKKASDNFSHYVQREQENVVTKDRFQGMKEDVYNLKLATDRLQARVEALRTSKKGKN